MSAAPRSNAADLPVRPGEEPWTDAELKEVRAELESEVASLRADLAKAASDIAERLTDAVRDAGDDTADAGTCSTRASARWTGSMREHMEYANHAASRSGRRA